MHNPLEAYRRTQRELRRHYDAFTRAHCATCPTPCCRQPARILPTDIRLAEAAGWRASLPATSKEASIQDAYKALQNPEPGAPCVFLRDHGCTFPSDLRPFGCTTYVCRFMYEKLNRKELARIRRLVREMEEHHTALLRSMRPVEWDVERDKEAEATW